MGARAEQGWLAELIDWEASGHLAWCRDAIDAEGAVVGHLRPAGPAETAPTEAEGATVHRRAAGAWIEARRHDLPALAAWYEADPTRQGIRRPTGWPSARSRCCAGAGPAPATAACS